MSGGIEELSAKQAITEGIYRYCRALDRMDRAMALGVWHPDGTADYGPIFKGTGAGFVDYVFESHKRLTSHSHQVTNILIAVKGETAASEAYVTAALRGIGESGVPYQQTVRGRYADRWSRRNGHWAIDARLYIHDFDDIRDIPHIAFAPWGTRGPDDPSHSVFRGFV